LLFDLAPVHYKGPKALPFKLHRNRENLRHTLLV
jgi:hypothetical protein